MISNFLFNFIYFLCYSQIFLTKLLTLRNLFSTAARATLAAKLVILGIPPLNLFILALRVVLVAKLVISSILSSILLILASNTSFSTTFFFTTSLIYLNQQEHVPNYQHLIYLLCFSN